MITIGRIRRRLEIVGGPIGSVAVEVIQELPSKGPISLAIVLGPDEETARKRAEAVISAFEMLERAGRLS